jgi:hypothetical protein
MSAIVPVAREAIDRVWQFDDEDSPSFDPVAQCC